MEEVTQDLSVFPTLTFDDVSLLEQLATSHLWFPRRLTTEVSLKSTGTDNYTELKWHGHLLRKKRITTSKFGVVARHVASFDSLVTLAKPQQICTKSTHGKGGGTWTSFSYGLRQYCKGNQGELISSHQDWSSILIAHG